MAISQAISSVQHVKLLHRDSGEAANRTVFTFAGPSDAVIEAAFLAAKIASEKIDMRIQHGEHPRIGALDVCPFVPILGISIEELLPKVDAFAKRVSEELNIPVFLYEESASALERKNLANHRKGEYEQLEARMRERSWVADYGDNFNPRSGGMVCGVRNFLLAYNINLQSSDLSIAKKIAYCIRESGWPKSMLHQAEAKHAIRLKAVKSIAWYIEDFKKIQVSINLTNFRETPLWKVHESCKELAIQFGTVVSGSELIGLIPLEAILECGKHYHPNAKTATNEELISFSIKELGLDELEEFIPEERILEYLL